MAALPPTAIRPVPLIGHIGIAEHSMGRPTLHCLAHRRSRGKIHIGNPQRNFVFRHIPLVGIDVTTVYQHAKIELFHLPS